jgi:hypothetical protein
MVRHVRILSFAAACSIVKLTAAPPVSEAVILPTRRRPPRALLGRVPCPPSHAVRSSPPPQLPRP